MIGGVAVAVLLAACSSGTNDANESKSRSRAVTDTSLVAADRGPAQGVKRLEYEFGPIDILPGPEQHRLQRGPGAQADRGRLDHRASSPTSAAPTASVPPRRRDPPAPRRVAEPSRPRLDRAACPSGSSPPARRRRSCSCRRATATRTRPRDNWTINYMIHNLTAKPDQVWITYDVDFIPADAAAADGHRRRRARSGWTCRTAASTRSST